MDSFKFLVKYLRWKFCECFPSLFMPFLSLRQGLDLLILGRAHLVDPFALLLLLGSKPLLAFEFNLLLSQFCQAQLQGLGLLSLLNLLLPGFSQKTNLGDAVARRALFPSTPALGPTDSLVLRDLVSNIDGTDLPLFIELLRYLTMEDLIPEANDAWLGHCRILLIFLIFVLLPSGAFVEGLVQECLDLARPSLLLWHFVLFSKI